MRVDEDEIRCAIIGGAHSVEAIGEACEAGTGCQSCHEALSVMLSEDTRVKLRRSESRGALRQLPLFEGTQREAKPGGAHAKRKK